MVLLMFYGTECVHCHEMMPLVKKLEKEIGVKFALFETWHNAVNKKKLESTKRYNECGGVPFFYNDKTGKSICGAVSYEELKKWAQGK